MTATADVLLIKLKTKEFRCGTTTLFDNRIVMAYKRKYKDNPRTIFRNIVNLVLDMMNTEGANKKRAKEDKSENV